MIGISYGNALLTAGQRKYQTANSNRKYSGKGGFGTKVPNEERYIKTVSRGNFETCAEVDKIPCKYALKDEKAIGWHWKAPGIEYRFFHAAESTEENPVLVARGVDEHGKLFEEKIAVKQIDPYNTTPLEIDALSYFRPGEHYSISTYNLYGKEPGINERFDYVARTQERLASCNRLHLSEEAAWNKKVWILCLVSRKIIPGRTRLEPVLKWIQIFLKVLPKKIKEIWNYIPVLSGRG